MKCPGCNTENTLDSRFCKKCATALPLDRESVSLTKTIETPLPGLSKDSLIADKYRIIEEIGRGGMGIVYKAEDTKLKRTVALKFLPHPWTSNESARERFIQEARAASILDHPNICNIHEIEETKEGGMFIAMAYYRGESLKQKIEHGPLEPTEVVDIALQMAEGLAKAHETGLVHRDVKPGNILLTSDGLVKVLDFGLAKLSGDHKLTLSGTTVGTAAYMSPEQARGENVDQRADIWSLGVVLYEMVTGELPFGGDNQRAIIHAILNKPPRAVKCLAPGFPAELEKIICTALAKDPSRRFASTRELASILRDIKDQMGARPYKAIRKLSFGKSRARLILVAASVVLMAGLAISIRTLSRPSLAFERRDKLMVADVENMTGDPVFDLALRTAIEASLQQSPFVAIFDRPQITETLQLMRLDAASKVDEKLGYEVCRRGQVRAFILPRVLSAGEAYEIEAILIDPVKRRHVDRIRVTARGREEVLLHGIDKLAELVRSRLGESIGSIEKAGKPVAQVMTSSWEALDLFSRGHEKWEAGRPKETASLMAMALEKDPQFVHARITLGMLEIQFLSQAEHGKDMLRQSLKDAENQRMSQDVILGLKAAISQYVYGDLEGALEQYRLLRELYPDDWTNFNDSGVTLRSLGRYDEAISMFEQAAKMELRDRRPLGNLCFTQAYYGKNPKAAENSARRWINLAPDAANPRCILGHCLASQGRFAEAEKEFRKVLEIVPEHPYGVIYLANVLFALGKAGEAVPFYRQLVDLVRQETKVEGAGVSGSASAASFPLILALRESGDIDEARKLAAALREPYGEMTDSILSQLGDGELAYLGLIEAADGRQTEANEYLQRVLSLEPKDLGTLLQVAKLCALLGRDELAIATLKRALDAGYRDNVSPVTFPEFQSIRSHPQFRALFKLGE